MKEQTVSERIIERLTEDLKADPFFDSFKFRKRDCSFISKFKGGFKAIALRRYYYGGIDILEITPEYLIRFDILHKWFEPFHYRPIQNQRDDCSIWFSGRELNTPIYFEFHRDPAIFEKEYEKFKNVIIRCSKYVFSNISTIEDIYKYLVIPVLKHKEKIIAHDIYIYLIACRLAAPENYPELKRIALDAVSKWLEIGEPSIEKYYPRMDEIFDYLENHDLKE